MSVLTITLILGFFVWGASDRWFNRRKALVIMGAVIMATVLLVLAVNPTLSYKLTIALFIIFALAAGVSPIMIAHGKALFSDEVLGRGLTVMNTANMGGVFVIQAISGLLVTQAVSNQTAESLPPVAYSICFGFMGIIILLGVIAYSFSKDRKPFS